MQTVILVIHLMVATALVAVVLWQRSEVARSASAAEAADSLPGGARPTC